MSFTVFLILFYLVSDLCLLFKRTLLRLIPESEFIIRLSHITVAGKIAIELDPAAVIIRVPRFKGEPIEAIGTLSDTGLRADAVTSHIIIKLWRNVRVHAIVSL